MEDVVAHMKVHKLYFVQMNLSPCQYMLWCWLLIAAPLLDLLHLESVMVSEETIHSSHLAL